MDCTKSLSRKTVGPSARTASISVAARPMLMFDRYLMPLSTPVATDTVARAVIARISTTSTRLDALPVSGSASTTPR